MTGHHTLSETEQAVADRLGGLPIDMPAMAAVSNIYRAANAVRNHLEQSVLRLNDLTWTGFVVLWVVWIWDGMETRHVAAETGISKGTLTGVAKTLEARGLLERRSGTADRRLVQLHLTEQGNGLMERLFPAFNAEESFVVAGIGQQRLHEMAEGLRHVVSRLEDVSVQRQQALVEAAEIEPGDRERTGKPWSARSDSPGKASLDGRQLVRGHRRGRTPC